MRRLGVSIGVLKAVEKITVLAGTWDGAATAGDTPSPFAFDLAQRSQMRGEDIAAASGARPSAIAEAFRHR